MKRKQRFIANTFLLTAVTLFLRAVGVSFNVYIANKIGAAGMGLFSLIMSVYNFGVTFACSGINLASTKIVSEEMAVGAEGGMRRAVAVSCLYGLVFGGAAFLLIFFGAPFAGNVLLNDERTVKPLMILSVSLPCVAMSAAISGYFSAVGRVYKSALAQVAEQFIRVAGCIILLDFFDRSDAGTACNSVVASGCAAEIISFLLIFVLLKSDIRRYSKKSVSKNITKRMLWIALPVAVSSYVRSALSTVEHTMIPKGLKKHGSDSETALSAYGTVHGMVMPLILFPSAGLQAVSSLLIPEVTMYHKRGDTGRINALIEKSLYTTLIFSVGASGILFFFAEEIGMAVYKSREAAYFLKLIAPLAVVMYADGVVDAVLKGLNQQVYSMGYNIADSVIAIVLMVFLLPAKGIDGYIIIIYVTEMVNAFLSINRLLHVSDFKIHPLKWTVLPAISIFVSVYFVKSFAVCPSAASGTAGTIATGATIAMICAAAGIYAGLMLLLSARGKLKTVVAKRFFV